MSCFTRREFLAAAGASSLLASGVHANKPKQDVEWLVEIQTLPAQLPAAAPKLFSLLEPPGGERITDLASWSKRRAKIRATWEQFLGRLNLPRSTPRLDVLEEDRRAGCVRQLVRYESEPGLPVEGYLLKPDTGTGRRPGVVVLHSTVDYTIRQPAGLEGPSQVHFGLKLAQKGYIAFCPRCFLWQGDGKYTDHVATFQKRYPGVTGMAKMLWDATRAVDVLVSLDDVDSTRLGSIGHSLGAKEALYLAAFDERVKVTVSSEGGIGIRFSNWNAPWYLGSAVDQPGFALEHHELLALIAPRPFLLLGGDSADGDQSWPFIAAALHVYRLYEQTPKVGLFNHKKGHSVPPEAEQRIYEWFETYLK